MLLPIDVQACGEMTATIASGDVREVGVRESVLPDGTVVLDHRGDFTLDLMRGDDVMIDELDVSGATREVGATRDVIAPNGGSAEVTLDGPSLVFPSPGEEELFAAARSPGLSHFKRGEVTLQVTAWNERPPR